MKIAIATDHAGFEFKEGLQKFLVGQGYDVLDLGVHSTESVDYPDYAKRCCDAVVQGQARFGILICGSGIGMSIAANKIVGVRAALVHDPVTARLAAEHNAANVLCLGARLIAEAYALTLVDAWLEAAFEARHQVRIDKIHALEAGADGRDDDRGPTP